MVTDQYEVEVGLPRRLGTLAIIREQKIFNTAVPPAHKDPYRSKEKRIFTTDRWTKTMLADLKRITPAKTEHRFIFASKRLLPSPWYTGDFERPIPIGLVRSANLT